MMPSRELLDQMAEEQALRRNFPEADRHAFSSRDINDNAQEAYQRQAEFKTIWSYTPTPSQGSTVQWDDSMQLGSVNDKFELRQCWNSGERMCFRQHISKQLLLDRLITIFGWPRVNEDEMDSKCIWSTTLFHSDGSQLRFFDSGASPAVTFLGTAVGSMAALDLLDFIVSRQVTHPYLGIVAGRCG